LREKVPTIIPLTSIYSFLHGSAVRFGLIMAQLQSRISN